MSNRPSSTKSGHRSTGSASRRVADARGAGAGTGRWWIVAAVVVVVLGALAVAVIATKRSESSAVGVATAGFDTRADAPPDLVRGTVQVTGAPLPEFPRVDQPGQAPPPDPGAGQPVPALAGQRFDGQPITIPASGKPKVVMFVAHWCPHCQKEVPLVVAHLAGRLPADVDLFAVSTSVNEESTNFPPGAWLRRENWPVPTLADDAGNAAAKAYGLSGFPYFVAVDASGKVVSRQSGELPMDRFDALLAAARG